jgi:hypothetical protein
MKGNISRPSNGRNSAMCYKTPNGTPNRYREQLDGSLTGYFAVSDHPSSVQMMFAEATKDALATERVHTKPRPGVAVAHCLQPSPPRA